MMKKMIFSSLTVMFLQILSAQGFRQFLAPLAQQYNLSINDIENFVVSSQYNREETSMEHVYLQQTVHQIPVFNAIFQLHIHKGTNLIFHNSRFIANAQNKINTVQTVISMHQAFQVILDQFDLQVSEGYSIKPYRKETFVVECPEQFIHPVRIKKVYFPQKDSLILAYEIAVEPKKSDAYSFIISASDGVVLWKQNRTISCQFDHKHSPETCGAEINHRHESGKNRNLGEAVYNAYPFGIESPIHGSRALLNAVELPSASPFGWHDVNGSPGAEFDITRGNNVYAHEDINDANIPGYSPSGGPDLIFDFIYVEGDDPLLSLDASITNLFVWNNFLHDVSYFYGFDEVSGNFQQTNYSGQGVGEDFVFAHALDGSGTNNANFGTPEEGFNPTMQMYVWEHYVGFLLEILEPSAIAGEYETGSSSFGVPPPTNPFTAEIVLVNDGSSNPLLGCGTLTNSAQLAGKIAYFDRGSCPFVQKVQNAQNAGAIGAIIANNQAGGPNTMGGDDNGTLFIPVLSISQNAGVLIKEQLNNNVNVVAKFGGEYEFFTFDSSFDNGIIAHEYGHGISNRLTGGGFEVNCLWGEEQMGEGWSDFFSLIVSDTLGALGHMPRGIGNFASNKPAGDIGIRPYPYTTDMNINPLTYQNISGLSIPHGVGSVWATMLWDLYWAFVDAYGHSHSIYSNSGGNNKAIRLVMEGMRLQACDPGFIDGRDAILAADDFLYASANQCLIWETFARRGLGFSASQGSSGMVGDEIEAFDVPGFCLSQLPENQLNLMGFEIFPNPGNDIVTVKISAQRIERITVFDVSGNVVKIFETNDELVKISTSDWANGIYLFNIQSRDQVQVLRWSKN